MTTNNDKIRAALQKRWDETDDKHGSDYVQGMNDAFAEALALLSAPALDIDALKMGERPTWDNGDPQAWDDLHEGWNACLEFLQSQGHLSQGWRPIGSYIYKEGESVLVTNGTAVGEARYYENEGWWWESTQPTDYANGKVWNPIKWQPLPLSPTGENQ